MSAIAPADPVSSAVEAAAHEAEGLSDRDLLKLIYTQQARIIAELAQVRQAGAAVTQAIEPFRAMAESGASPMAMLGAMMRGGS